MSAVAFWSSDMWGHCSAFSVVHSTEAYNRDNRVGKDEGIKLHELAYKRLTVGTWPEGSFDWAVQLVSGYVADIEKITGLKGEHCSHFGFEQVVRSDQLGLKGKPDAWAYREGVLYVWDLKTGWTFTDARSNNQLICYAMALIAYLDSIGIVVSRASLRIYMSELDDMSVWNVTVEELGPFIDRLIVQKNKIDAGDRNTRAGFHCRRCTARYKCSAVPRFIALLTETLETPYEEDTSLRSLERRLLFYRSAKSFIERMETAASAELNARIQQGERSELFKTRPYNTTVWVDESFAEMTANLAGSSLKTLVSPHKAKEKNLLPRPIIDKLTKKSHTGTQLVRRSEHKDRFDA